MLMKLLGGERKEIPSRTESESGTCHHWIRLLRECLGAFIVVDELQAQSLPLLAPLLLPFDAALLSGCLDANDASEHRPAITAASW